MVLNISIDSIRRILTGNLGMRKVCSRFVPHKLTDDQKLLRIQHSRDIIKETTINKNFLYNIVTGDEMSPVFSTDAKKELSL